MIAMIDNYDSFTYNIVQELREMGADLRVFRNDSLTVDELDALALAGEDDGVVAYHAAAAQRVYGYLPLRPPGSLTAAPVDETGLAANVGGAGEHEGRPARGVLLVAVVHLGYLDVVAGPKRLGGAAHKVKKHVHAKRVVARLHNGDLRRGLVNALLLVFRKACGAKHVGHRKLRRLRHRAWHGGMVGEVDDAFRARAEPSVKPGHDIDPCRDFTALGGRHFAKHPAHSSCSTKYRHLHQPFTSPFYSIISDFWRICKAQPMTLRNHAA